MKLSKPLALRIAATFVVILVVIVGGRYGLDKWEDMREEAALNETIQEIILLSDLPKLPKTSSFHDRIDTARILVNDNSVHDMDEEFYAIWRDHEKLANEVIGYLKKERVTKPHMECSSRSNLLAQIIGNDSGYDIRNVVLYNVSDHLLSHRVIEIKDPLTGEWETQDADYDVYWKRTDSDERVSLPEVVADPESHHPCGRNKCGWDYKSPEKQEIKVVKPYLGIISVHDKKADKRFALYGPNVDPAATYTNDHDKTGTFCELFESNCEDGFLPAKDYKEYK